MKKGSTKKSAEVKLDFPELEPHWTERLILFNVTEEEYVKSPKISHVLKAAGMLESVWDYLEGSSKPQARALLDIRDQFPMNRQEGVPFEVYCLAAKIRPQDILLILTAEVFDQASKVSALLAASQHPLVTEATIQAALSPLGTAEKKMLHQHAGFLPISKNTIVNVRGDNAVIGGEQKNVLLRPVEESVKMLGDRFNSSKALPQAIDVETITVDDDD